MRIVVLIKQILDPKGITVRRDKERMFINREEYVIDPGSKAAIEAALRVKESGEATVVAVSLGKPEAEDALREALALGCDEATLLSDPAWREADVSVAVRALAAAVKRLGGADLVICGRASGDTGAGQIGPRLAEALGCGQISDAFTLAATQDGVRATRRWGAGYAEVATAFPAVVTVAPEAFPIRYAHGARIMNAYRLWTVTIWSAADLELDVAALTPLLAFRGESFPPPLELGEKLRGKPETIAHEIAAALRQQHLAGQAGG